MHELDVVVAKNLDVIYAKCVGKVVIKGRVSPGLHSLSKKRSTKQSRAARSPLSLRKALSPRKSLSTILRTNRCAFPLTASGSRANSG